MEKNILSKEKRCENREEEMSYVSVMEDDLTYQVALEDEEFSL